VGAAGLLLGIVGSLLTLLPSVRIEADRGFHAKNPLYAPFMITNEGPLPIRLVQVQSRVDYLRYPGMMEVAYMHTTRPVDTTVRVLQHNEQAAFSFPYEFVRVDRKGISRAPDVGDMTIDACYQSNFIFWFWRRRCSRRFMIWVDAAEVPRWFPCLRNYRNAMLDGVPKPVDRDSPVNGTSASAYFRLLEGDSGDNMKLLGIPWTQ
jgi:hypothetical protein